jgi:hypothetical protein
MSAPGTRTCADSTGSTISSVHSFGGTWHSGWSLTLARSPRARDQPSCLAPPRCSPLDLLPWYSSQVLKGCLFVFFLCTMSQLGTSAPGSRTRADSTGSMISSVRSFGGTRHEGWSQALARSPRARDQLLCLALPRCSPLDLLPWYSSQVLMPSSRALGLEYCLEYPILHSSECRYHTYHHSITK